MITKISISENVRVPIIRINQWKSMFIETLVNMDVVKIADMIDDDIIINDQTKWEFLAVLRDQLNDLKAKGNEKLRPKMTLCLECNRGCDVVFFAGKEKGQGIGILFKYQKNKQVDIIICNGSTGTLKTLEHKDYHY